MKIVVGLGNPGNEYKNTRHNTGRIIIGILEKKFGDKTGKNKIKFLAPDTFMNNSGKAVASLIKTKTPIMVVVGNPPYSVSSSNKGEWIQNLIKEFGVPQSLREFGVSGDDIDAMAEKASQMKILKENPVEVTRDGIKNILEKMI